MDQEKKELSAGERLKKELFLDWENAGLRLNEKEIEAAYALCEEYKVFLDSGKTERSAVNYTVSLLESRGYVPFDSHPQSVYKAGDKVYLNNRGKAVAFAVIGSRPVSDGVKIIASHIDSPRIDLKPRPLYEEAELAMFRTHYYGGIRKYQWVTMPLSLHGVIIRRDGAKLSVNIGEDPGDPVFVITDLLPHLAKEQNQRKLHEGIKGEELSVLIGSLSFRDDKVSEKVKLYIIDLLHEKYGIAERDFLSAELCMVPAHKARDVGFDRSMIGAYGHDDRVCAYASLIASLESETPAYTWINIFADKEETGSDGNTGLNSRFLEYFVQDLARMQGAEGRHVLSRSQCLSADVNLAFDPKFPEICEKRNTAYLNRGVVVTKYTGSGGKSSTNDASAEFVDKLTRLFDEKDVIWQTGELGRVDAGGGGTVAKYISKLGADVVDIGVPVLSMHSPTEVVSKLDVYCAYKAFAEFLKDDR